MTIKSKSLYCLTIEGTQIVIRAFYNINTNHCGIGGVFQSYNREERKIYAKVYTESHKEERKVYRKVNKDKIKIQQKHYREANKEKIKINKNTNKKCTKFYNKQYRENNKEQFKIYRKIYYENNRNPNTPKSGSLEDRICKSCSHQGITRDEWTEFLTEQKYCIKFNNQLRKQIRNNYNNCDYISGLHKDICNNDKNLDVHHVNYNKQQGCGDHEWKLIPLSRSNHTKTNANREFWNKLFIYSLEIDKWYYGDDY